jgi:hypothetical protein
MKITPPSPPTNCRLAISPGQLWAKEFNAAEGASDMMWSAAWSVAPTTAAVSPTSATAAMQEIGRSTRTARAAAPGSPRTTARMTARNTMSSITAPESWSTTASRCCVLAPLQATEVKEISVEEVMAPHSALVTACAALPISLHRAPKTALAADLPMLVIGFHDNATVTTSPLSQYVRSRHERQRRERGFASSALSGGEEGGDQQGGDAENKGADRPTEHVLLAPVHSAVGARG